MHIFFLETCIFLLAYLTIPRSHPSGTKKVNIIKLQNVFALGCPRQHASPCTGECPIESLPTIPQSPLDKIILQFVESQTFILPNSLIYFLYENKDNYMMHVFQFVTDLKKFRSVFHESYPQTQFFLTYSLPSTTWFTCFSQRSDLSS